MTKALTIYYSVQYTTFQEPNIVRCVDCIFSILTAAQDAAKTCFAADPSINNMWIERVEQRTLGQPMTRTAH